MFSSAHLGLVLWNSDGQCNWLHTADVAYTLLLVSGYWEDCEPLHKYTNPSMLIYFSAYVYTMRSFTYKNWDSKYNPKQSQVILNEIKPTLLKVYFWFIRFCSNIWC